MRNPMKIGAAIWGSLSLAFIAPCLADESKRPEAAESHTVVYLGATLIDGTGGAARQNSAIAVKGDTIIAVGKAEDPGAVPAGARVVNVKGLYVLPGLIDSHVHLATPPNRRAAEAELRRQIFSGITAVRDMADDLRSVGELARESRVGEVPAPDIYYAALMAGPSFFSDPRTIAVAQGAVPGEVPWMQAITERTDMPLAVAMARGTYASAIKIYANLPGTLVKKITDEAHRQGFPVWAHSMVFPATPEDVIDAGVDVMSHVCYFAYQIAAVKPSSYDRQTPIDPAPFVNGDNPEMAALFAKMHTRGIILDATDRIYTESEKQFAAGTGKAPLCPSALAIALTVQAYRAGVQISTGTDGDTPWSAPYPSLYEELELLSKRAGIPNAQVIHSATQVGARTIGHERDMGAIAPGMLANMLFVSRDPLADIGNLRSVSFTLKRGTAFHRTDYVPISAAEARQ